MQILTQPTPVSSETIDDRVANLLTAGTNVTLNYDDTANTLTINSSGSGGGGTSITNDGAKVLRTTNQSVPGSTLTVMSWESEALDQAAYWSSGQPTRLTIPQTGWYTLYAQLDWAAGGSADFRDINIRVNGSTYLIITRYYAPTTGLPMYATGIVYLTAGDYAEVVLFSNGGAANLQGSFSVMRAGGGAVNNEDVQDIVGAMFTDTATIDFTYNDTTSLIIADVKDVSITEAKLLLSDNTTQNSSTTKHGLLPKLNNSATSYLDGTGAWSTPAGGGMTTEQVEDIVGAMLGDTATIDFTYSDVTSTISAQVKDDSITFFQLQNVSQKTVLGRSATDSGNVQELTVGTGLDLTGGVLSATTESRFLLLGV